MPRPFPTRRAILGAVLAAGTVVPPRARAQDERRRIALGGGSFLVPKPFLFGEFVPPAADTGGLPPRFSFAFLAPGGAPAGEGLEFPPASRPYVLERDGGQFLVLCYRVSASGPGALNKPPRDQLANHLITTDTFLYGKNDGALVIRSSPSGPDETRYLSLIDERNGSGVEALLGHVGDGQFFFGNAAFEKAGVTTVIYVPQQRRKELAAVLVQASGLLMRWKES